MRLGKDGYPKGLRTLTREAGTINITLTAYFPLWVGLEHLVDTPPLQLEWERSLQKAGATG